MSLHNFNSNTKSWKMYTNTLTSVSGDDLLVMPSYGKDLILEVSANNDIFFKKGEITKRFDNLVSDYLDMSFVREASFNSLNSQIQYILQEISGNSVKDFITSGISNDLLIKSYDGRDIILEVSGNNEIIFKRGDLSYNLDDLIGGGGGGGSSQNSDYAKYNILDITGKIIFTDNSNIQINNDASFNNVHISGSLNVAGTVSASNIYTKSQVDASFSNVYTKSQVDASLANIYTKSQVDASLVNVYTKSQVDASLANIYTKSQVDASLVNVYTRGQVDVSFVSKQLFDASLSSIQLSNVYTKSQVDASFVSKQLFEASYNVLAASNGGGSGGYIQNNENISFDILNITDTIIFTDSSNVELYNDASFNNVDVSGSLKVAGTISASNIYTKSQVDVSFVSKQLFDASLSSIQLTNVYTKTEVDVSFVSKQYFEASYNVYSKTEIDASFANVYTKSEVDASFDNVYTKSQVDASFANVYTKSQVDVSFVSKQLFDASINALAVSGGGGSSTSIYDTNIKILPDWTPIVEISNSLYTGQNFDFGRYIVYSNDGTTLATCLSNLTISGLQFAGRVIIYHNNGSSWVQKGQNLDGTQAYEYFGRALSLSSNGNIIAIGSNNIEPNTNRRGSVKIYSYNLSTLLWEQIGGALRNFNTNYYNTYTEQLGNHVALSGDGTVLIVGAMQSDLYSGRVISYKYEIRNTILDWYVTGIVGYYTFINDFNINTYNFSHEYFGSRVALSLDGTVMAVYAAYAPSENGDGDNNTVSNIFYSGVTRTFKWNGSVWVQTGRFIGQTREAYPIEAGNFLSTGTIISLSGNGNTIAIGEPNNISNGYNNGKVSVYYWNNNDNSWNKLGADIYGEGSTLRSDNNADDEVLLGISVSLSNDGTIIAVTGREAPYIYSSYPQKGRVYKFEGTAWNKLGHSFREGRFIALSGDGNYLAVGNSFNSIPGAEHGMNRISMSIYTLVSNKIVSLNSTNLFFNDGYSYSYKKRNIHNLNLVNNDANAVHTDFFSDFPNKFTRILYIAQNGDLYNRNNTYGSFSDIRLKENIIDATPKLQDLLKVRVVNYNLKGSTNKQIGVLAQELEEIFPGLVETENSGEKYKSVKYSCINIMLVKALQEQQVLISDMSSNINTLKDEIATLKQNMASLLTRLQALEPNAS